MVERRTEKGGKARILVTHYPLLKGDVDNWYDVTDAVRPLTSVRSWVGIITKISFSLMTVFRELSTVPICGERSGRRM